VEGEVESEGCLEWLRALDYCIFKGMWSDRRL
jgi:hypothetical protein